MDKNKVAVVIPTLNNKTINDVVKDARSHGYEVVVVDDGSSPKISEFLPLDEKTHIVTHEQNRGKGMALISGAKKVKELGYKYFVAMDADGQHLASEIIKLVDAINEDEDMIIIGSRNFDIENVPNGSKIGRRISNFWAALNTSQDIKDSLSGFRLYPTSIIDLKIKTEKFDWEIEVLVKHAWLNKNIKEVIVECYYPDPNERVTHFKKWRDTISIIWVHARLLPLKPFLSKR